MCLLFMVAHYKDIPTASPQSFHRESSHQATRHSHRRECTRYSQRRRPSWDAVGSHHSVCDSALQAAPVQSIFSFLPFLLCLCLSLYISLLPFLLFFLSQRLKYSISPGLHLAWFLSFKIFSFTQSLCRRPYRFNLGRIQFSIQRPLFSPILCTSPRSMT